MNPYLTKEEIVDKIIVEITDDDKKYLKSLSREDMIQFHHGIGTSIRNEYGLWKEDNPLTQQWALDRSTDSEIHMKNGVDYHPQHPDAVSMDILEAVWDKLNEKKKQPGFGMFR